jgi:regulatory protein YycH of two-component signal transduction system YycFG
MKKRAGEKTKQVFSVILKEIIHTSKIRDILFTSSYVIIKKSKEQNSLTQGRQRLKISTDKG